MYESARSRTCLHAKHQPCQADNVPALRGPRHACWRGGGIRRKAHEVAWTRVSQATRRFPFRATLPLPRNAFPSAQRFPFHATLSLPRNAFPSAQRFPFHATFSLPRNIFPSTQLFPFHATLPLPRNISPAAPRPSNVKPLARPATPSRTCESLPDQGYKIGTCYHGTRALHLWAPLHCKWPQKSLEEGIPSLLRYYLRLRGLAEPPQHNRP